MYRFVKVLCEGFSEERFIKDILAPYLLLHGIIITPITLGGVSKYAKIRKELKRIGKDRFSYMSTMLDYYKLPKDVPGFAKCSGMSDVNEIASCIEAGMKHDLEAELNCREYLPYIMMHEFEALLFSDVSAFTKCDGMTGQIIARLEKEASFFPGPEHINNGEQTAPSKRILRAYREYQKVSDGLLVAHEIGIEKMLEKCGHGKFHRS